MMISDTLKRILNAVSLVREFLLNRDNSRYFIESDGNKVTVTMNGNSVEHRLNGGNITIANTKKSGMEVMVNGTVVVSYQYLPKDVKHVNRLQLQPHVGFGYPKNLRRSIS
jgi:type IV secretory pathway component VirB8